MSSQLDITHDKVAVVQLDDYATTGSRGGTVVEVDWIIKEDLAGSADDDSLPKYSPKVENWKNNPDTYKIIYLTPDTDVHENVQIGWILDSQTGTTLRDPNT